MNRIEEYRKHLFEAQRMAIKIESDEELTDEQIDKKCAELQTQIINNESINNRFRNPVLQRIFTSPPRFKKI